MPKMIAFLTALLIFVPPVTSWSADQVLPRFGADVRVLGFDPHGRGRLVVALGDPVRARDIAVVVPGSDVDVRRFDTVLRMARAVHDEAGRDDLAVIAWLGYDTPEGLGIDAATGRPARAGAEALAEFTRGLLAGRARSGGRGRHRVHRQPRCADVVGGRTPDHRTGVSRAVFR